MFHEFLPDIDISFFNEAFMPATLLKLMNHDIGDVGVTHTFRKLKTSS